MCEPSAPPRYIDPAEELATLVSSYVGGRLSATTARALVRDQWDKLKSLAHAIHNQEMCVRLNERKAAAEKDNFSRY
jgi:hypothetical protein